ncbi:CaiB/BaiF CoA transferase family protein [Mycolicibacterium fluoranthenivorans]|uniref:Crotonobetainyl-CoA:carnitine CoA-transferase CaiB-like acyl-CoA transferase n=1 Tax=Mycolicibacterium fluoranthenivorans TaxID=258505 RepID=A0A7X5ZE75_9MYCO|nr:CoA transferase [Mycolicibacterium fluoranthenivorans]MCV7359662.1 CoA transferase [Mycolicibacterium fluoranthenivorans]NIH96805.1 crotonobetainyl-CoA:carnitine CoA-transferase CaiB-like acyl-CoA transferase [Mycolicibacterium fluoranthenivorans]
MSAPLAGYTVVDLSSGIAGAYATKILADGGADVVKVEDPQGDPLRTWSASGSRGGALFAFLAGGKRSVVLEAQDMDLLERLIASADAVVWSPESAVAQSVSPQDLHRRYPHLIVTAITAFGLDGPWSGRPATEFTLQAWSGGAIGIGRGTQDRAPVTIGGQVGDWLTGAYAAAMTLAFRARALRDGHGEFIDLSKLEAQVLGLTYYPVTYFEMLGRPWRTERRPTVPGVAQAADGLVALGCGTAQQWWDLCAMSGHDEWIDETTELTITEQANLHAEELYEWIRRQPADDLRDLAAAFRIPNSPVGNGENVTTMDHFVARDAFVRNPADGFVQPAHPYRFTGAALRAPAPAPGLGEHSREVREAALSPRPAPTTAPTRDRLPFSGLRVLDMTTFWAGPSCTHALGMLGADIVHLESTSRPDGTRLIAGIPATVEQWWERSPIFSALNTNKKSVTVDFQTEAGRDVLRRLIAASDVVVENFTPRVIDQLGLDFDAVRALREDIVMVRMPGFGLQGPWRDNPAFAYIIEDASGLSWLTGYPDRPPFEPYSVGDPNAGVHALNAVLLALEHRRTTGQAVLVEAAMVDAALNIAAEQVIEYSAYGALLQRDGNRGPTAAPQNLYRSAESDEFGRDDSWVAIAVQTDAQWEALRAALGSPDWSADPALSCAEGRRAAHDVVDDHLAAWCRTRTGDVIVENLWGAGVPVAKVMQPHRQTELPQLRHRRFFEHVGHPVNPVAPYSTLPVTLANGPAAFHREPAPLLGEHNHVVLTGLGLSDEEIAVLVDDGVIGTEPGKSGRRKAAR